MKKVSMHDEMGCVRSEMCIVRVRARARAIVFLSHRPRRVHTAWCIQRRSGRRIMMEKNKRVVARGKKQNSSTTAAARR